MNLFASDHSDPYHTKKNDIRKSSRLKKASNNKMQIHAIKIKSGT